MGRLSTTECTYLPTTRLVVSKDNASSGPVFHRYVCFEPVPAAMLW